MPLGDTLVAGSISANSGGMATPAANSTVTIDCNGAGAGSVQVTGAGWGGTIILEGRINAVAADWQQITLMNLAGAPVVSIGANGLWIFSAAPFTEVRARSTAWAAAQADLVLMISPVAGAGTGGGGGGGAVTLADGADVTLGTIADVAAEGDAAGTVNAHLRGIDKVAGATADAAIISNAAGSLSGKLRGLVAILADVWDSVAHALKLRGLLTHNNAAPGADNLGVLPAVANAAAPAYVEGDQVLLSTDLRGAQRTIGTKTNNGAAPTTQLGVMPAVANGAAPVYVEGNQVLLSTDLGGAVRAIGTKTNNTGAPTTQIGVLPAVANAAAPAAAEGNQVLLSIDLFSFLRTASIGYQPASPVFTFTRPANTTPYSIGDEVGTAGTAASSATIARANGTGGIVQGARVFFTDYPATVPQLIVFLFDAQVTLVGDNGQFALSDADALHLVCHIPLAASQTSQYSASAPVAAGGVWLSGTPTRPAPHFLTAAGSQMLYACLVTLNAWTAIANSSVLTLQLDCELN